MGEKELPKGWVQCIIDDVADVSSGIGFPNHLQGNRNGEFPFYKVGDISQAYLRNNIYLDKANNYISEEVRASIKGKLFPKGTIVFAKIGEALRLNRRAIISKPALCDNNVMGILPNMYEMHKFIYYFFRTQDLGIYSAGNSIPSIRKSSVVDIPFLLPPLAEQNRIVEKLDKLFSSIEIVKTKLDNIPQLLKNFRQAVLNHAVTGKLTEKWRTSIALKGWTSVEISDVILNIEGGKSFSCPSTPVEPGNIGLVKISAVTWGTFDERETKTVTDIKRIDERLFINEGDFLISRANTLELVGAPVVVGKIENRIMLSDKVWRVIFKQDQTKYYVNYLLRSNIGRKEIESRSSGNQLSMRNISQNKFKSIPIHLPPLSEQTKIVSRVESLFAKADAIEKQYQVLKGQLASLPQVILSKAFAGELVEQVLADGNAADLLKEILALKTSIK